MKRAQREYLERVLVEAGGKVYVAAQLAGVNRTWFYHLIQSHSGVLEASRRAFAQRQTQHAQRMNQMNGYGGRC